MIIEFNLREDKPMVESFEMFNQAEYITLSSSGGRPCPVYRFPFSYSGWCKRTELHQPLEHQVQALTAAAKSWVLGYNSRNIHP
jgi:hypothetical protein